VILRVVLAFLVVSTLGCHRDPAASPSERVARIGFGIGPSARAEGVNILAQILYAEPLLGQDWSGRLTRRLAQDWQWSADGKTVTLRLKKGVKFHDGTELDAQTVVRFLKKQVSSTRFGLQYVSSITPGGEDVVTITLSRQDFFLLPVLTELWVTHPDNENIATGPFKLVSKTPTVEATRFDQYHGGPSALAGVTIQTFNTQRSAWAALLRGDVDVVQELARGLVDVARNSSHIATYPSVQPFYMALALNHRHPALGKREVRRALVESIDRRAVIERVMQGRGRVAEDPIWPFHWAYPATAARHEFSPTTATTRLDEAGFRLPSNPVKGEIRKRFSFRCLVYNEDPLYERMAQLLQRYLFDVGIVMDIELVNLKDLIERSSQGDYDAFLLQMHSGRTMDYTYRFWRSGAGAEAKALNPGYTGADVLLDELRESISEEKTARIVQNLVDRFHRDVPAVFIAWTEMTRAVSTQFDVGEANGQDPFFNIWRWRPREVAARK
jgi:peptide/nickel transport system substrate-binding protein